MNRRLVGHIVLLVMFVLATGWSVDRLWSAWRAGDTGRIIIPLLATLGFVSLSIRELNAVARARRGPPPDAQRGGTSIRLH